MTRKALVALGVVLACLGASLAPGPAGARTARAEPDWRNLAYVHSDGTGYYFALTTNAGTWEAQRIVNVPTGFAPAYLIPEQLRDGKQIEAIWAKTCPATKSQTVTLIRKVELAGQPGEMLLNLQRTALNGTLHRGKNPISSLEVRLNGSKIASLKGKKAGVNTWKSVDVSAYRNLVVYGTNTLTLIATKAKTKKKDGFCSSRTPDFGVAAELVGRPQVDLQTTIPPTPAYSSGVQATATIVNTGPSHAVTPSFNFQTGQEIGGANVTGLIMTTPNGECTSASTGEGYSGTCRLPALGPGAQTTVLITVTWTMVCPGNSSIAVAYWSANLWQDTNRANDGRSDRKANCVDAG